MFNYNLRVYVRRHILFVTHHILVSIRLCLRLLPDVFSTMFHNVLMSLCRRVAVLCGHTAEVSGVQYSWDSSQLASASLDGSARLWDARQRSCTTTFTTPGAEVTSSYVSSKCTYTRHPEDCKMRTDLHFFPDVILVPNPSAIFILS